MVDTGIPSSLVDKLIPRSLVDRAKERLRVSKNFLVNHLYPLQANKTSYETRGCT